MVRSAATPRVSNHLVKEGKAAANSRARMPWGRVEGAAPGYPAAAARLLDSPSKIEQRLTVSRRSDG
jgi:hypothetical protein